MAIARTALGTNAETGSSTTITLTGITLSTGDLLVVGAGSADNVTVTACTWGSESLTVHQTVGQNGAAVGGASKKITSGGTQTITATFSASCTDRAIIALKGADVDTYDVGDYATGNATAMSVGPTSTTTADDELVVAFVYIDAGGVQTWSGDTDQAGQSATPGSNTLEEGYEIHSTAKAMTGTATLTARSKHSVVIVTFKQGASPQQASAACATCTTGSAAATVTPGGVSAPAGLATTTTGAAAATVTPGAAQASAALATALATALACTVTTGGVSVDAALATTTTTAQAATVTPGGVSATASLATCVTTTHGPMGRLNHPPTKLHHAFGDSGIHRLDAGLLINSQTVYPTGQYNADAATATAWPAKDYGNDLASAGSGDAPTPNQGSPLLGSQDDSILYAGAKYHQASGTTFGNVGTNDLVPEVFFKCVAGPAVLFAKRNAGVGYEVGIDSSNRLYLTIEDSGGSVTVVSAVLTVNKYYYGVCFADRSGSAQWYVNAAASGSPVAISSYTGTLDSSTSFTIGADSGGNNPYDGNVCYVSLRHASAWLDTHLQVDVAEERCWKLAGIWPELAQGTARPNIHVRSQDAFLEKIEGTEIALYGVGEDWPRIQEEDDKNGRRIRGYKSEDRDDENICKESCTIGTSPWSRLDGGDGITSNGTEAPNKQDEGSGLIGDTTDGQHGFSQIVTTVASTKYVFSCWVKPGNNDWVLLRNFTDNEGKYFNVATGAKGSDLGSPDASYIRGPFLNGWYRCEVVTTTAGTSTQFVLYSCNADNDNAYQGGGVSEDIWFWGAQIETNKMNRASSLLVTTTAAVGRETEDLQMKMDDGNMGGVGSDLQGVWEAQILLPDCDPTSGSYHYLFRLTDGGVANDRFECWANTADGYIKWRSVTGAGISGDCSKATDVYDGAVHHIQGRWKPNVFVLAVDGSDSADGYVSAPPDDQDELDIGCTNADQYQFSGLIANLNFWQKLEAYPAAAQATANAPNATAQISLSVNAQCATTTTTAPNATVSPGGVSAAAGLAQATADAPAATVTPGTVAADAELAQATANAQAATVTPGAVQATAELATAVTTSPNASVVAGGVQVSAELATTTADAISPTVTPGAVQVNAALATTVCDAPNATASIGGGAPQNADAQCATCTTTAPDATVTPGAVQVTAQLPQATVDAPTADATIHSYADAQLATTTTGSFDATVTVGGVQVSAQLATTTADALAPSVTPGPVTVDAQLPQATVDAPNATVSLGVDQEADAQCATAKCTALAATVTLWGYQEGVRLDCPVQTEARLSCPVQTEARLDCPVQTEARLDCKVK